jgi:RNA polymerase sigma-70 factor (ECF subfamily)
MDPERNIIQGCLDGDRSAQKALYDRLAPKMYALCLRYMGDREQAQDILQDGFVTLFSKIETYSGEGSFEGWARKIFVNTALQSLRRTDALKLSDDLSTAWGLTSHEPGQLQDMGYKEILGLVASLPGGYRTVFNMYVIEGYSHKEIAQALGISEATSRSQLQRARMMLQDKMKRL